MFLVQLILVTTIVTSYAEVNVIEKNIEVKVSVKEEIRSLGYPNSANVNDRQVWHITSEPGSKVELYCDDLRISPTPDCEKGFFEVDDGSKKTKFCGSESGLTTMSRDNKMTVVFELIWATGLADCTVVGVKDEGEGETPASEGTINIPLGSPSFDGIFYRSVPGNTKKSWEFTTDTYSKIGIFCQRLGVLYNRPCDQTNLKVGDELVCGNLDNYTKISSENSLKVVLTVGTNGGSDIDCLVQAVSGPHADQYRNVGSLEIDSSEHGGPAKGKGTTCPCGYANKEASRIVSGQKVKLGEYPWMVALKSGGGHFCGGSIISPYHVLTAAHCTVGKDVNSITVTVGTNSRTEGGITIAVKKKDEHKYDASKLHLNDIAVLTLEQKIEFNDTIGPVCLRPTRPDFDHEYITVMGWGYLGAIGNWEHPDQLRRAHMKVVDFNTCSFHWYRMFNTKDPDRLCTWASNRDSCYGDSGGPLVWLNPAINRFEQVGLVSFGRGCNTDYPKVNTLVPRFYEWIQGIISGHPEGVKTCQKID